MSTYIQSISNHYQFDEDYLADYFKFPERRLAYAVINRALYDIELYLKNFANNTATNEQYGHAKDARAWLRSQTFEVYSCLCLLNEVFPDTMTNAVIQRIEVLSKPELRAPKTFSLQTHEPFPTDPDTGP